MKNINVFSQIADRLSRFDKDVWDGLVKDVRRSITDYKIASNKDREIIVDVLHTAIEKHQREIAEINLGKDKEQSIFELQNQNKTSLVNELESSLELVYKDFVHHFPTDKNEIAKRLDRGCFFQDLYGVNLNTVSAIDLLRRIANDQEKSNLATSKPAETKDEKKKGILRRIPYWIYIFILFLAALLTCLYYLGWLDPIKAFIVKILWHN